MSLTLLTIVAFGVAILAGLLSVGNGTISVGEFFAFLAVLAGLAGLFGQHSSSISLQREANRDDLRLKVYEALTNKIRSLSLASSTARLYPQFALMALQQRKRELERGETWPPVEYRARKAIDLKDELNTNLSELIAEVERWEAAIPAGEVFRLALVSASHNIQGSFFDLFESLVRLLPMERDVTSGELFPPPTPTEDQLVEMSRRVEAYQVAVDELACYCHDLRVEMQNNVLEPLFGRTLEKRKPIDPQLKVIDPKHAEELMHHFRQDTDFGRTALEAENAVRRSHGLPEVGSANSGFEH